MKKCNKCNQEKPSTDFYKGTNSCKPCKDAATMAWREKNRAKYNSDQRVQHKKNYSRNRLYRYNLTPEQYQQMLTSQDNKCALCHKAPQGKRPLAIDHDHSTGKVRGLLCYGCNRLMVLIDNEILLEKAKFYAKAS